MAPEASDIPPGSPTVRPGAAPAAEREFKPRGKRRALGVEDYVRGVLAGDRAILGRTFSLMESIRPEHRATAAEVVSRLAPRGRDALRLGISGPPGVGKSTFIEALGKVLLAEGHRVAVLSVDPSSELTGGSILGDKTRMEELSRDPAAFVRPTACGRMRGGAARGTRESIIVCEAAGFDVVIVESVGVGQSETDVASMVDFFLVLMIAGAGDELQGMKRGILELADAIAINKADGDNIARAEAARTQLRGVLRLLRPPMDGWTPPVEACSALAGTGIAELWAMVQEHRVRMEDSGARGDRRARQAMRWFEHSVEEMLLERLRTAPGIEEERRALRARVVEGAVSPFEAAERLVSRAWPRDTPENQETKGKDPR